MAAKREPVEGEAPPANIRSGEIVKPADDGSPKLEPLLVPPAVPPVPANPPRG